MMLAGEWSKFLYIMFINILFSEGHTNLKSNP